MISIDLHTHSVGSPDGSITVDDYRRMLSENTLQYIAITDHDTIEAACAIQSRLGQNIIIGEEITTTEGEIIGLFLKERITPQQTALATAKAIKAQGGLVYIPHPFETVRKGITRTALDTISQLVDIVEVNNGRAVFQNKGPQAATWAKLNNKAVCASSDAHGAKGLGATYTQIAEAPTVKNLVEQLQNGRLATKRPPLSSLLYPKLNRVRGKLKRK